MKDWIKQSLVGVLLASFVAVLSFGSLGLIKESHVAHTGCPFAAEQQGMCPMMSLEHVEFFSIAVVVVIAVIAVILISFKQEIVLILEKQQVRFDQLRRKKKIPLYQNLFSQGILNPKAP